MVKAVLFDVDGVLIDSFEANLKFFQNLMLRSGYKLPTRESFQEIFPLHLRAAIRVLTKADSEEEMENILKIARSRETGYDTHLLIVPTGAKEVLEELAQKFKLGIVTSRENAFESPHLAKLAEYFDVTVSYGDTENHKPHPEPLLCAAQKLGVKPEECIYIGDASSDLRAGRAAGMKVIMYGNSEQKEADVWAASFSELPALISFLSH